ncbi:heme-binding protein [Pseudomonas boanensis]|uniref:GlcG/HbpS family heme-binding protein n=1 Tax=Metapseudomonas boanensis TaxID=2822138 RepID=UPI0035D50462
MNAMIRQQPNMTLALAMPALQATLEQAIESQVRISIALVDAAGQLIHMAHMDGAPLQCRDIALNKALTAVGFGIATSEWGARLEKCSPAVQQGLPLQPRLALFGGGEPVRWRGDVIGAIGVSGASEQVDTRCAQAGVQRALALLEG